MVTDDQVRLLRQKLMEGKKQETAAAAAAMNERSARKWQDGPLPSDTKQPRTWRTRGDPLGAVLGRLETIGVDLVVRNLVGSAKPT